jgi:hypothetical protein
MLLIRALAVWGLLLVAMVVLGWFRERWLRRWFGEPAARQVGTALAMLVVLGVATALAGWIGVEGPAAALSVGAFWLALTMGFEILMGRWMLGLSWARLLEDYNLRRGRLWPLLLLVTLLAPLIATWIRGL